MNAGLWPLTALAVAADFSVDLSADLAGAEVLGLAAVLALAAVGLAGPDDLATGALAAGFFAG